VPSIILFISVPDPRIFAILDKHQDALVRGTDPRIRIRILIRTKCHRYLTLLFNVQFVSGIIADQLKLLPSNAEKYEGKCLKLSLLEGLYFGSYQVKM
jgi:hypothetical protein